MVFGGGGFLSRIRRTARGGDGTSSSSFAASAEEPKKGIIIPTRIIIYTVMLVIGMAFSQITAVKLSHSTYHTYSKGVELLTMFALSFIMIGVGHEFDVDKSNMRGYLKDYLVAMSAAGLPWIFVAVWLRYALPGRMAWGVALLMARFAAPTSAGILFSMLEAAGLKGTWFFRKAQVLAIFDDLDTILLMIPLKMYLVGFKPELLIDLVIVTGCIGLAWTKLHKLKLPSNTTWTMVYAAIITAVCEIAYIASSGRVHLEILLPAFALGCVTALGADHHEEDPAETQVKTNISTVFMMLVGLSMPSLFDAGGAGLSALTIAGHVFVVSILMVIGKCMLLFTYRDESNLRTRLALSLGMCPRGEVGAGIIAISLKLGFRGPAVTVAVLSLATNLILSSGFIVAIQMLLVGQPAEPPAKSISSGASPTSTAASDGRSVLRNRRVGAGWGGSRKGLGLGGPRRVGGPLLQRSAAEVAGQPWRPAVRPPVARFVPVAPGLAWAAPAAPGLILGSLAAGSGKQVGSPGASFGHEVVAIAAAAAAAVGMRLLRRGRPGGARAAPARD